MFKIGDKVVGVMLDNCKGVKYLHSHLSPDTLYEVLGCEPGLVDIQDDLGVISYWTSEWFKKVDDILTDEEIQAIDDSTHFHESVDWSVRFARNVLKAAEDKKKMGNNNVLG